MHLSQALLTLGVVHFKVLNQPKTGMTNSHKKPQTVCFHLSIQKALGYPLLKLTLTFQLSYKNQYLKFS